MFFNFKVYERKKKIISPNSNHKGKSTYKRNDLTLIYLNLRKSDYVFNKIKLFFDSGYYLKKNICVI